MASGSDAAARVLGGFSLPQNEVTLLRNEVAQLKQLLLAHKDCPVTALQKKTQGYLGEWQLRRGPRCPRSSSKWVKPALRHKGRGYRHHHPLAMWQDRTDLGPVSAAARRGGSTPAGAADWGSKLVSKVSQGGRLRHKGAARPPRPLERGISDRDPGLCSSLERGPAPAPTAHPALKRRFEVRKSRCCESGRARP